ncbi:hypothetical protein [Roseivirga pacifica]|uniref:hypothetical protein n=1 Tax=Roseivirga pacifica TaxID=1267423 RepID=UPI003BB029F3
MRKSVALVIIILLATNNNLTEFLVSINYSAPVIMLYKGGLACLVITIIMVLKRERPKVKNSNLLFIRVILGAISIWLFTESYEYLSAGSVALVQRMDIAFLVLLAYLSGRKTSSLQFYLSVWTIIILLFFALDARFNDEDPIGFLYALSGVLVYSATILIIKSQTSSESKYTIALSFSFSSVLGGFVIGIINQETFALTSQLDLSYFLGGAGIQVAMVFLSLGLLKSFKAEYARLPYVLGALATFILEMIIEGKVFNFNQIGLTVIIVGLMLTICLNPNSPKLIKWEVLGKKGGEEVES